MGKNTDLELKNPGIPAPVSDSLTELLREGARRMLMEAVEAEVQEFLCRHAMLKDGRNRQRVVRNGYLPERRDPVFVPDSSALPEANEKHCRTLAVVILADFT